MAIAPEMADRRRTARESQQPLGSVDGVFAYRSLSAGYRWPAGHRRHAGGGLSCLSGSRPGGFIGVDIFFVISGFLITGIIVRELDQQRFSLLTFYSRRIRRIFPALIVVLGRPWCWAGYGCCRQRMPAECGRICECGVLFEYRPAVAVRLFRHRVRRKPLLHLWSLGIEEQFYLFWPLDPDAGRPPAPQSAGRGVRDRDGVLCAQRGADRFKSGGDLLSAIYPGLGIAAGAALACSWGQISQTSPPATCAPSLGSR